MKCLRSGESLGGADEVFPSSGSLASATKDFSLSASGHSCLAEQIDKKLDTGNVEEAESSLRESGVLNYEVHFINNTLPLVVILNNQI